MRNSEVLVEEKKLIRETLGPYKREFYIMKKEKIKVVVSRCKRGRCVECWGEIKNNGLFAEILYSEGKTAYISFRFYKSCLDDISS